MRALVASQIREVANEGMDDPDVLPFYVGQAEFLYQVEVMGVGAVAYDKAASLWFPKGHGKGASLTSLFNAVK